MTVDEALCKSAMKLKAQAESIKAAHTISGGQWMDDAQGAQAEYDELLRLALFLTAMAS